MALKGKVPIILIIIGCGISLVLLAASTATVWMKVELVIKDPRLPIRETTIDIGLWRTCTKMNGVGEVCQDTADSPYENKFANLEALQAFSILAVLACMVAGVLAFIGLCTNKMYPIIPGIVLFVAAICAIIAGAMFAKDYSDYADIIKQTKLLPYVTRQAISYSVGFFLCWVGTALSFITGLIAAFAMFIKKQ